jgi:serine phosphatase RsbU (regulator of sigma subunit)
MREAIAQIATVFWPELNTMGPSRRLVGAGDVFTSLYSGAIALAGIIWLTIESDWGVIRTHWALFILIGLLLIIFNKLNFFMIIQFRADRYGSADGAFDSMMVWAGVFLLGPTSLWLMVVIQSIQFVALIPTMKTAATFWNNMRNFMLTLSGFTIPYLVSIIAYTELGGVIPFETLDERTLLLGIVGIAVNYFVFMLIWLPYFLYALDTQKTLAKNENVMPLYSFFFFALSLPTLAHPFSILAAGLYMQNGLYYFLFFIGGLVVVAYLARQYSWIAESNRQQSRQLEKLEHLGRALLNAPPDGSTLSIILDEHIPTMFPSGSIAIWLIPGQTIFKTPEDWEPNFRPIWDYVSSLSKPTAFLADTGLAWDEESYAHRPIICAPIMAHEGNEVIGGIYLELRRLAQPWDQISMERLFPGIQALTDQISSTIYQSEEYAQSLAMEKIGQEIQIAGQIQASFLPNEFPNIPGWQLAVTLEPAGGLSGDFFDFIPLSRDRLGIVVADVADKGLGAALYMALCRTLIRTYALEYHSRPDIVFAETNERILSDARANLFITAFYGVLDPEKSTLTYVNAGHNPPYLFRREDPDNPIALSRTGMPIGIEEESTWARKEVSFNAGDSLVLYTDGVTDAQNEAGEFFDDGRLQKAVSDAITGSAFEQQANILNRIRRFIGDAEQFDDITIMVLARMLEPEKQEKSEP